MATPTSPSAHTLLALQVPVVVEIGRRQIPLADILGWEPGTMIELTKAADAVLELRINALPVATGSAVKVGEKFGLRIGETTLPDPPGDAGSGESMA